MFHVARVNGARPAPVVGPEILGVPQDLRDLFTELVDTEVPMTESAAEKIMAYIGKSQETVLAKIDTLKDQNYAMDKRISSLEGVTGAVRELDVRLDGHDSRLTGLTTGQADIARDVAALKKIEEEAKLEKNTDRRTVRNALLQSGAALLFGVLLTAGGIWLKAAVAPAPVAQTAPQAQQDAQNAILTKMDELVEEIRTDRAARDSQPAQTIKVPPRGKPRSPAPPLGPGAMYKSGDVLANPELRAYSNIRIESMEWRP